jgi:hypothetical protein
MPTTYWGLNLYMNPGSANALNGRFETPTTTTPRLQTASGPNGPWTTPTSTDSRFTVAVGDCLRINVIDLSNKLSSNSVQMAAVFGRDNAGGAGSSKSSPFTSANGRVSCVMPGGNIPQINSQNAWGTGDWTVQQATSGNYRFLIFVVAQDNQNVEWQFGHDPEMDVAGQR